LRHSEPALLDGGYVPLNENDSNVLSYLRKSDNDAVIVAINMSAEPRTVNFDLAKQGVAADSAKTLLTTQASLKDNTSAKQLLLEPFAVYIGTVTARSVGTQDK
jgi:alpha-glucosidase